MRGDRTFTTYMNVEVGKGNDRALSQFERQANDSLRRVQQTAERAGAMATGVTPATGSPARIQMLAAAERQRAQALQGVTRATREAEAASGRRAGRLLLESNAARAAAASTSRLERSLRLASVAANVAQGPLGPIAGRLSAMATAVRELAGVRLGLVGVGAAAAAYGRYASTAQDLVARLRPLYDSQVQVNAAFKDAQAIANNARVGLEPVIDLYARLTLAGREAGLSQQRISRITEIASKAAKLSGGTAVSQEAGLYQFAQGIGSGTLQGDELRSVRENTLRLAKAIADGLDVPIGKLKELGKQGKLTPQVIADALEKEAARIDAEMAKLPVTISSATTKLSNAFIDLVTETEKATGVAGAFGAVVNLVADNLTGLVRALGLLAAAYAGLRTGQFLTDMNARVTAWQTERREILKNANEAKSTATAQRQASASRIVALRQERVALQQQIAAEQALANEKRRAALDTARFLKANAIYSPGMGGLNQFAGYTQAVNEARVAQDNLAASKNRLRSVGRELTGQTVVLTNASRGYRTAALAAQRASITLGNAMRGLWAAINPVGLALAFAIPLLIEFAFRQDAAAGSADRMAEAQNRLARFVDQTTGRILNQNAALVQNEILTAKKGASDAREARMEAKKNLSFGGDRLVTNVTDIDPRVRRIRDQVRSGRLAAPAAARQLASLRGLNAPSQAAVGRLTGQLADITTLAQEELQGKAAAALLAGQNDPETRRRAFGNFTGTDADFGLGGRGAGSGSGAADEKLKKARGGRARATDEAAKAERELQRIQDRTDKRTDILARYDEQATALDRAAKDARELGQLVGEAMNGLAEISKENPLGKGIYTAEMAAADAARISYGVRKPIRDAVDEQERGLQIAQLRLEGYDLEATALERALSLQDQIGQVTREELETLIRNEEQQLRINDALAARERQTSQILGTAQATRDAFEDMLVGLNKDPAGAIKGFYNQVRDNFLRIQARQLTEKLFAGADEKLRELIHGSNGVDRAADILARNVKSAADSTLPLKAANDNLATATEYAARRITDAANGISGGSVSGLGPSTSLDRAKESINQVSSVAKVAGGAAKSVHSVATAITALGSIAAGAVNRPGKINGEGVYDPETGVIVVQGGRLPPTKAGGPISEAGALPSGTAVYNSVFEKLGDQIKKGIGGKIGGKIGTALQGVGYGQMGSSVGSLLGIRQSGTGAAIGGAIGNMILPGIGGVVGGFIGGTIGGLFKSKATPFGSSIISGKGSGFGTSYYGTSTDRGSSASSLTGTVIDQVNAIAAQLGATVNPGVGRVSIGIHGDKYRVDPQGRGYTNTQKFRDVLDFGDNAEAAVAAAVADLIKDGVISGISQASQNILRAGGDMQKALEKALAIESIPKRLAEKQDPVRFAVQQLNDEFTKLIGYLKEGRATTQQYADAQKLYELERKEAIERAGQQASAIQAYLDELVGGSSSPLNKRTTYENAATKLNSFRADIDAGKSVDENELLTAARNFQDASSALFGSSQAFFTDFDSMFALLSKARDNLNAGTSGEPLPGSPFAADPEVARILGLQVDATNSQTDILADKLQKLIDLWGGQAGYVPSLGQGAIAALPGFGGGGGGGGNLGATDTKAA